MHRFYFFPYRNLTLTILKYIIARFSTLNILMKQTTIIYSKLNNSVSAHMSIFKRKYRQKSLELVLGRSVLGSIIDFQFQGRHIWGRETIPVRGNTRPLLVWSYMLQIHLFYDLCLHQRVWQISCLWQVPTFFFIALDFYQNNMLNQNRAIAY